VGAYVDATWANASATQLLYGTPPDPATRLPFRPGAGWLYGNTGLGMGLDLSRHWSLVGGLERHYLASPVDLSPLVQQRQNTYWTAGVLYVY
jgi:outer membrane scaffolding protein for murein synthesis (MipA/OmpV family)